MHVIRTLRLRTAILGAAIAIALYTLGPNGRLARRLVVVDLQEGFATLMFLSARREHAQNRSTQIVSM
jgi:hypothetical protein